MTMPGLKRASRTVLTYGRFDGFHQGHVRFLRQAAAQSSELIVGLATDEFARETGIPCRFSFDDRRALLQSCRFVSRVIPEISAAQKRTDIINYDVCNLVMDSAHEGHFDDLKDIAQVTYLPRRAILHSTHYEDGTPQHIAI
ncbi:adenylyltransferase/cytidyltransferase family protein [Marimonas sp. MJW-29]|uniref:ethanolamine-phosphate cytidylyltransferase n=1 Tax=Sulfitobacter sediminis TaxID=3234186 RepID=A0ABV3RSM5_9RHOB